MNSYRQSLYIGIIRVTANLLMVVALFLAMRQAFHSTSWPSEAVFCLIFFGLTIPVWLLAILLTRWIRNTFPAPAQSIIDLPGKGTRLVRWRVLEEQRCVNLYCGINKDEKTVNNKGQTNKNINKA